MPQPDLTSLASGLAFSGQQPADLRAFLLHHGQPRTLEHCLQVAELAREFALQFDVNPNQAQLAGWLHDCSAVIPSIQRLQTARLWGVEVLPEEAANPLTLHQKLSVVIAQSIFKVEDPAVLSAIGCHTTLKAGASRLDKVVFLADKLAWDQVGVPPYLSAMQSGAVRSLDAAALAYLDYLNVLKLGDLHPWAAAARAELSAG